jgi:hypothetical protein
MNKIYIQYKKLVFPIFCVLMLLMQLVAVGQSGSFGNTFIFSGAEMGVIGVQHNFQNGGSGVLAGIVGTERTSAQGYLSFSGAASWTGAADNAHVDGYVKTYMTTAFTFPIGDNAKYRPAAVSIASVASPADAAYFGVSASTAITTSLKGGNEPILPTGATFSTASKDVNLSAVDNVEYWDINGATSAKITLTWDANSAVGTLTSSNLSSLTIVGWDGSKWVVIPSTVDVTSLLGGASSLTSGSITTNATVSPNTYNVYTLGSAITCVAGTAAPIIIETTITNTCPTTTFSLAGLANTGTKPSGTSLIWSTHKVPTSAADTLTNLTTVSTSGKFYAMYYDKVSNCYSPADSITATIAACPGALVCAIPPAQTALTGALKTGNAATELTPTGGTGIYTYSNGNSDPACIAPSGATAGVIVPVVTTTGEYTYTAPLTAGVYYFCIKVCDTTLLTPICKVNTYTVTVSAPAVCAAGTAVPTLK